MSRRPTQVQIARLAGVSQTTVTFVLNDRQDVAIPEATRQRVKAIAAELGYRTNPLARALVSGRTGLCTLVCPSMKGGYYTGLLHAFEGVLAAEGCRMIVTSLDSCGAQEEEAVADMLANGPDDAIVMLDSPLSLVEQVQTLCRTVKQVATISTDPSPTVDGVVLDLLEASRQAVRHLLDSGARRIAMAGVRPDYLQSQEWLEGRAPTRVKGYMEVMGAAGLPHEFIRARQRALHEKVSVLAQYLRDHGAPEGVFCYNDDIAIAIYLALRQLGFRIPQDTLVVGCDGIEPGELVDPPLSTIVIPPAECASLAWGMVKRRMEDPSLPPQHVHLQAQLRIRGSSQR